MLRSTENQIRVIALGRIDKSVSWLGFIGVSPVYRGRRFGRRILRAYVEKFSQKGTHKVSLYSSSSLVSAIQLYEQAEFIQEGYLKRHSYGMDLVLCSKFIE
ncbi:MAG: GNAT family N-acetyltransferase [Candidatus Thorarchaeota archaeon]|nr:GNAT family N-acetyltransferase [Candidatus Thorarchaeota archaeon]